MAASSEKLPPTKVIARRRRQVSPPTMAAMEPMEEKVNVDITHADGSIPWHILPRGECLGEKFYDNDCCFEQELYENMLILLH